MSKRYRGNEKEFAYRKVSAEVLFRVIVSQYLAVSITLIVVFSGATTRGG